jgi:hypothetical protein
MKKLTIEQILSAKLPGDIFSSPNNMEREFTQLALLWHPDKNPDNLNVMPKINEIRDLAEKQITLGIWEKSGSKYIKLSTGKSIYINYILERKSEFGTTFICDSNVIYLVDKEYIDLANNFIDKTKKFKYASTNMENEVKKYLPQITTIFDSNDKQKILVVNKTDDLFSLYDVLRYYSGSVPCKHVAWILSTLYNLACYLRYADLVHNAITLENYFICSKFHSGALLGGWFYTANKDEKMKSLDKEIFSILPYSVKKTELASSLTDLESIKLIGRTLLGDKRRSKKMSFIVGEPFADTPEPMKNFLKILSTDNAHTEYKNWTEVLKESFGPKKFIEMKIDKDKFYKQLTKE